MIYVYPTRIEIADSQFDPILSLERLGPTACIVNILDPLILTKANTEGVLAAVRDAVKMLGLED